MDTRRMQFATSAGDAEPVQKAMGGEILIIDDDSTIRLLAATALRRYGLRVREAASGQEGIDYASKVSFAAVLLDLRLPDIDGLEVCRQIRDRVEYADVPIMVISGRPDADCIQQVYSSGATDFLPKPLNWLQVYRKLSQLIEASDTSCQLRQTLAERSALVGVIPDTLVQLSATGQIEDIIAGDDCPPALLRQLDLLGAESAVEMPAAAGLRAALTRMAQGEEECHFALDAVSELLHFRARSAGVGENRRMTIIRDVTKQRRYEQQLERLAFVDESTGLGNRLWIQERCEQVAADLAGPGKSLEVTRLMIENAAAIGDLFGEVYLEELMQTLAERLKCCSGARSYPPPAGSFCGIEIARSGMTEFAILRSINTGQDSAAAGIAEIHLMMSKSVQVKEMEITPSLRIGIAGSEGDIGGAENLFQMAGIAALEAADASTQQMHRYDGELKRKHLARIDLEARLRRGLAEGEICLHYQPKFNPRSGALVGFEALARWKHRGSLVSPGEFIPVAEASGLIMEIGDHVLDLACRQISAWNKTGLRVPRVAVNLAAAQLMQGDLAKRLQQLLLTHELPAGALEVEITESSLMHGSDKLQQMLDHIRDQGIKVALDDFGTGYSSLAYLHDYPLDVLKIDRSFVTGLPLAGRSGDVIRAIMAMATAMNMQVVAEGVETCEQLDFLADLGCDCVQGFLTGRPQSPEEAVQLLSGQPVLCEPWPVAV